MQFGAHIFGVGELADPKTLVEVAQLAENLGYHSIFVADHIIVPRGLESKYPYSGDGRFPYAPDQNWLDPMVALGYLAGLTQTIRLGTSVTVLPMRHPIITAKQIVSADHLSGGRVIFGAGVGWMAEEFALLGESFHDRGRRADEYLQLIKILWTQENPNFEGTYFHVSNCGFAPKSTQRPHVPIWIGGESKAALRRAARVGNGWHSAGTSLAALPEKIGVIREELAAAGRSEVDFVFSAFPTDRFTVELIGQFAAHGISHMLVPVFSFAASKVKQRLERVAKDVIEVYQRGAP
jgi:probable F420-dependent oxidoreductase